MYSIKKELILKRKSILIFIAANNFSEDEFLTAKFILEKNNFQVFVASDSNGLCKGDKDLKVKADVSLFNIHPENFSAFILIGGIGVRNYWNNSNLLSAVNKFAKMNKPLGAICAAPVILAKAGTLVNQKAACFIEDKNELQKSGAIFSNKNIVINNNIVTASNKNFTKELIEKICDIIYRT